MSRARGRITTCTGRDICDIGNAKTGNLYSAMLAGVTMMGQAMATAGAMLMAIIKTMEEEVIIK